MKRDFRDYLADILASMDEVAEFTQQMIFADFARDRKTCNAVVRSLEVLGEAANASRLRSVPKLRPSPGREWPECATS
jgi:uncharacterized protein with HEPN domain